MPTQQNSIFEGECWVFALVQCLMLGVIIWQLREIRRLLRARVDNQPVQSELSFQDMLDEQLAEDADEGWGQLRRQALDLQREGMSLVDIARTLGLGRGEVQLLLLPEDNGRKA
ncbi:MAG: DUF6115 domain-containing protein [Limnochordia bacterium]|jgi:transposase-like protein